MQTNGWDDLNTNDLLDWAEVQLADVKTPWYAQVLPRNLRANVARFGSDSNAEAFRAASMAYRPFA